MRKKIFIVHQLVVWGMTLLMALPPGVLAQQPAGSASLQAGRVGSDPGADRAVS